MFCLILSKFNMKASYSQDLIVNKILKLIGTLSQIYLIIKTLAKCFIKKDSDFLCSHGLMDYSLLLIVEKV